MNFLFREAANILSCMRFFAPVLLFGFSWLSEESRLLLCIPLGFTDFLDGKVARWKKRIEKFGRGNEKFGKNIDPIADKVMILSLLVFSHEKMDAKLFDLMITGELLIVFLFFCAMYCIAKRAKSARQEMGIQKGMANKAIAAISRNIEFVRKTIYLVRQESGEIRVNPFGKFKTAAYFLGGVFLALHIYGPVPVADFEIPQLSRTWYVVAFQGGIVLWAASFIWYIITFAMWINAFGEKRV